MRAVIRVARLVRVSTSHIEQADSPQHQLSFIDTEIARAGWVETGLIYQAELTGAVIVERPDIRRMLADAAAGLFDAIVLKSISRLGRDTLGLLTVKRMLDDLQVELIALADGYRSFRDPELIFLVHAERAQAGRQEIAKNVRAGVAQAARRGIWPAGTLPFGLRKESRFRIGPDPETAPIVQLIFALRGQGRGAGAICRHLNREARVKAPAWYHLRQQIRALEAGEDAAADDRVQARLRRLKERLLTGRFLWQPRTVRLILQNPAYCGELRYNRTTGERRMHGRLVRRPRAPEDWVTIPCTPLVTRSEWEGAQPAAGAGGRRPPGRAETSHFLLAGLIACGRCGAAMRGVSARPGAGRRGGEPKGYYVCRASLEGGAHASEYVRATVLEEAVLERLRAELAGLPAPDMPAPRSHKAPAPEALQDQLRDLAEARFYRREEARLGRIPPQELAFELELIGRREAELQAALEQIRTMVPPETPVPQPESLHRLLRLEGAPASLKPLLRVLVRRVIVGPGPTVELQAAFTQAEARRCIQAGSTARRTTR
jgi:DNA invertase Pin-like site-specific DNA recombinase